jgi:hypothetical protein
MVISKVDRNGGWLAVGGTGGWRRAVRWPELARSWPDAHKGARAGRQGCPRPILVFCATTGLGVRLCGGCVGLRGPQGRVEGSTRSWQKMFYVNVFGMLMFLEEGPTRRGPLTAGCARLNWWKLSTRPLARLKLHP